MSISYGLAAQTIGNDTTIIAYNLIPQVGLLKDTTIDVVMPDSSLKYEKVLMHYSLNQPPGGWDPWDRIGYVRVYTATDSFEIGRIMTPYSKACSWTVDVTDFRSLLTGNVHLNSYILFYATGPQGYLVSISFEFIGGNPHKEAYMVKNLWKNDVSRRWIYGYDVDSIEKHVPELNLYVDPQADSVKVKVNLTGHGQGNTDNAAEFSNKTHNLMVNTSTSLPHHLWRSNCASNPCSPQSGTWQFNRAGWCPGADVIPWEADLTPYVNPGDSVSLRYSFLPYLNLCSPNYPNCVSGVTCTDCNYNSNGHVMPWYLMQSQIVYYRNISPSTSVEKNITKNAFTISPNPTVGSINIRFESDSPELNEINIINSFGKLVHKSITGQRMNNIDISSMPGGIYYVKVQNGQNIITKKIALVK